MELGAGADWAAGGAVEGKSDGAAKAARAATAGSDWELNGAKDVSGVMGTTGVTGVTDVRGVWGLNVMVRLGWREFRKVARRRFDGQFSGFNGLNWVSDVKNDIFPRPI
jgi:hypothetical protein